VLNKFLRIIVSLIITTVLFGVFTSPSTALSVSHSGGRGLGPSVNPGDTYTETLSVTTAITDKPADVLIEFLGYSEDENGVKPLSAENDTGPYTARGFFQPEKITLHCEPGDTKETQIKVTIPSDIKSGGRYATLRFTAIPNVANGGVGVNSAIVLPIQFTINGDIFTHTGEITGVDAGPTESGKPIDIFTSFKNTGNHHYKIKGEIEIRRDNGILVDTLFINSASPIPESIKKIRTVFSPAEALSLGTYSLKAKIMLEDGTVLDESTGTFEVKAPYVPPPPPASVTLEPSSAATLQTDDGRIIINFPQGAVLGEARVSLQSYPPEQLPSPPKGLNAATTCFRVDGLNGLLTKDAKMTVKYSSADLQKAGGDASKLQLARWDEVSNQWTVLKTIVDKSTMTLTASTNQFSLWAVMVGTPASPATGSPTSPTNWMLFAIIGGAAVVVIVAILLFIRKRKG
jgi:hypothetical protein